MRLAAAIEAGNPDARLLGAGVEVHQELVEDGFQALLVLAVADEGFELIAQAALKEATGSANKNSYTAAATYAAGPFAATLTYVKGGRTTQPSLTAYTANEKLWNLGASYDFGFLKAFGQYTAIKDTTAAEVKDKIYQLGVSVPVTDKAAVLASFGQLKNKTAADVTTKDEVFSLGYDYTLSKRTDVYGVFSNHRVTSLQSGQSLAVGIRHNF